MIRKAIEFIKNWFSSFTKPNMERLQNYAVALEYEEEALKKLKRIDELRSTIYKDIERATKKRLSQSENSIEAEESQQSIIPNGLYTREDILKGRYKR